MPSACDIAPLTIVATPAVIQVTRRVVAGRALAAALAGEVAEAFCDRWIVDVLTNFYSGRMQVPRFPLIHAACAEFGKCPHGNVAKITSHRLHPSLIDAPAGRIDDIKLARAAPQTHADFSRSRREPGVIDQQ